MSWQHTGTYTCMATNVVGQEKVSAKLSVQGEKGSWWHASTWSFDDEERSFITDISPNDYMLYK